MFHIKERFLFRPQQLSEPTEHMIWLTWRTPKVFCKGDWSSFSSLCRSIYPNFIFTIPLLHNSNKMLVVSEKRHSEIWLERNWVYRNTLSTLWKVSVVVFHFWFEKSTFRFLNISQSAKHWQCLPEIFQDSLLGCFWEPSPELLERFSEIL